jgi:hypothetical protein
MSSLSLEVEDTNGQSERQSVTVDRIANCGFTGRSEEEVRKHIEELEAEGISAPDTFPTVYPKPSHLITTDEEIEVISDRTSGEVEFVLFPTGSETYVGVGSDHTDRELEKDDIILSKTVCPNVVGETVWRLSDVADHWDQLQLRSWTGPDRDLYQESTLDAILPAEELLSLVDERSSAPVEGTAMFSGSVGTESGELDCAETFAAELYDPVQDRCIAHTYTVRELDWLS